MTIKPYGLNSKFFNSVSVCQCFFNSWKDTLRYFVGSKAFMFLSIEVRRVFRSKQKPGLTHPTPLGSNQRSNFSNSFVPELTSSDQTEKFPPPFEFSDSWLTSCSSSFVRHRTRPMTEKLRESRDNDCSPPFPPYHFRQGVSRTRHMPFPRNESPWFKFFG